MSKTSLSSSHSTCSSTFVLLESPEACAGLFYSFLFYFLLDILENRGKDQKFIIKTIVTVKM